MSYFLAKRVPYGETRLPVERYLAAAEQMKSMPVYSTATNSFASSQNQGNLGSWTYLGPGNIGGRTRGLLVDPDNSNVLIAGGVAGGIWKTTDGGAQWSAKSDLIANIAISALARGPADGYLYAGTGEWFPLDAVEGLGIYLSTDGGETWPPTPLAGTANLNFNYINRIVVSPSDPRILYAATPGALWRGVRKLNNINKYT